MHNYIICSCSNITRTLRKTTYNNLFKQLHLPKKSYLNDIRKDLDGTQGDPHSVDCVHEGLHEMRRVLENVRPHEVHEVGQGVLTTEPVYTQGHVLDGRTSSLSVHQISAQQNRMCVTN